MSLSNPPGKRFSMCLVALTATMLSSCARPPVESPRGVILMIGDGMGFPQVAFARNLLLERGERWAFESLPVSGIVTTWSASNATTDSGAAATAMAAGVKTNNWQVGTTAAGEPATSFAEIALANGWRVGYVTTTALTHATPAAFYAHVMDRYADEERIAKEFLAHGADVALGGGLGSFAPEEAPDAGPDLIREAAELGWTVWTRGADLAAPLPERLVGLFADDHLAFRIDDQRVAEEDRDPSLDRLTEMALEILTRGDEPFFLLVEGGRIDHACHSFDGPGSAYELQDFDRAVETVIDFREQNPSTLVLVTADHATGGLAINDFADWDELRRQRASVEWMAEQIRHHGAGTEMMQEMTGYDDISEDELATVRNEPDKYEAWRNLGRVLARRNGVSWTPRVSQDTKGHTGEDVPLYAAGPGAERFQGVLDNTDIADGLLEVARLPQAAESSNR